MLSTKRFPISALLTLSTVWLCTAAVPAPPADHARADRAAAVALDARMETGIGVWILPGAAQVPLGALIQVLNDTPHTISVTIRNQTTGTLEHKVDVKAWGSTSWTVAGTAGDTLKTEAKRGSRLLEDHVHTIVLDNKVP